MTNPPSEVKCCEKSKKLRWYVDVFILFTAICAGWLWSIGWQPFVIGLLVYGVELTGARQAKRYGY